MAVAISGYILYVIHSSFTFYVYCIGNGLHSGENIWYSSSLIGFISAFFQQFNSNEILFWKHLNFHILKEIGIPDKLSWLLRNWYAGQEATVRTRHGTVDYFQIGKEVYQGCILSLCLLNLYAEHIMQNAGLDKAQAGIKIAGKNANNLRYADTTTLMA